MSTVPLVSIVMCTYNGSSYLDEQLASIAAQDYPHFELIILDDCSTDDTWAKLLEWQSKCKFITLYKNETNLGYNKNFEKVIQLAKGDYISIADQDDVWLPNKISEQANALMANPAAILSHCKNVSLIDGKLKYNHTRLWNFYEGDDVRKLLLFSQFSGHTCMFKKELVDKIVPFPNGIIYDWWLSVNACCNGPIVLVDKVLIYHRLHQTNATTVNPGKNKTLDLLETLELFASIKQMSKEGKEFLAQFIDKVKAHNKLEAGKVDWELFRFIFKHRAILFSHRKRAIPLIAHLKYAYKFSKFNFINAGNVL